MTEPWSGSITPAAVIKKHGGAREGAGRPHEHQEYLLVEVVDFYGDKDVLIAGLYRTRKGERNKASMREAQSIAAHHVGEWAQSVRIMKRFCCIPGEPDVVEVVHPKVDVTV